MNRLQYLHSELERNYAWSQSDYQARYEYIRTMRNKGHMLGSLTLLKAATIFPGTTKEILDRFIEGTDYEYLGAGYKHTVVADGDEVLKIHRASVFMEQAEREVLIARFEHQHGLLSEYLGSMVLPQTTQVEVHPLNSTLQAVVSRQERIDFKDTKLFAGYAPEIHDSVYDRIVSQDPTMRSQLGALAVGGINLYEAHRMVPDTSGMQNVVINSETGRLMIMGGLPLTEADDTHGTARALTQLQILAEKTAT